MARPLRMEAPGAVYHVTSRRRTAEAGSLLQLYVAVGFGGDVSNALSSLGDN